MRWIKLLAALWLAAPMLLAAQANPTVLTAPKAQSMPETPAPAVPPPAAPQVAPRFQVLIDAAHGGEDTGARLTPELLEKNLTLDLSNRLRSLLAARGIAVTTTRNSDEDLSADERAEIANRTPYAACILIHATATGSGVHLYTSSLAAAPLVKFMPWETAQAAYVTQSLKLSSDIDSALAHAAIPVTLGRTVLQPMDSFACPAVAVEVAPLQGGSTTKAKPITDEDYQRTILDALAASLEEWRNDWRQQP
ncbi:MAG TPA: N-acetylmuramoyl-L-alanine amidase [Acidobacteriaceae bacterium]|nr:N-acetylmuramoyl-L-alanine amidase [Acidobacteriaceae bacterium]